MANFLSSRTEVVHKPTSLKCCGGDETTSMDSTKASMLECGEYVDQLSFWQRPRQRIDLEFVDVSYRVKLGRNGKRFKNIFIFLSLNTFSPYSWLLCCGRDGACTCSASNA